MEDRIDNIGLRPLDTDCQLCGKIFQQPSRKQGGGSRKKWCSGRCRSLAWIHKHPFERKTSVLKYESREENRTRKRLANRQRLLRKYNWTASDFEKQLQRQHEQCLGCLSPINVDTAKIDHDHETSKIRGLLCNICNLTLGLHNDDPMVFRRLMAYLDRDISKILLYIIGTLKNPRIPEIGNALRSEGYDVMDEWFTPGEFADANWQAYEQKRGRTYKEALRGRAASNIFMFDRAYLDLADLVVLVMPVGKSAMIELGYAKGRRKPTYILLDGSDPDRYDIMPNFADHICYSLNDLIKELKDGSPHS